MSDVTYTYRIEIRTKGVRNGVVDDEWSEWKEYLGNYDNIHDAFDKLAEREEEQRTFKICLSAGDSEVGVLGKVHRMIAMKNTEYRVARAPEGSWQAIEGRWVK